MRRVSLMTMTLFMRLFFKFNLDQDMEDLMEGYEEMLDLVAKGGFQWVDVTSWEIGILGLDFVAEQLKKRGLRVSSVIHPDLFAAGGEAETAGRIEKAKKVADATYALDCDVLMLVPQAQPDIKERSREWLHQRMIEHFAPILAHGKTRGLHVVIEDTPDLKLQLCRAADVKEVLDAVPGLELVYDSGNMILTGEEPLTYAGQFAGRIGYVHLKDMRKAPVDSMMVDLAQDGMPMSSAPTGTGLIDLPAVIQALNVAGYDGSFSVEFFVDDDRDYLKSIKRTKEYIMGLIP